MDVLGRDLPLLATPIAYDDKFLDYSFYKTGITESMTVPAVNGGTRFNRHMMNGIAYLASLGTFLWEWGYPFSEHDMQRAAQIGGYPQGAIVYLMTDSGYVVEYVSKIDNNTNPIPELQDGVPVEDEYWKPLYESMQIITVPDYSNQIATVTKTFGQYDTMGRSFSLSLNIPQPCMVVATRSITANQVNGGQFPTPTFYGIPIINISAAYSNGEKVLLDTFSMSVGVEESKSFPMGEGTVFVESTNYNRGVYGDITITISAYAMGTAR